MITSTEEVEKLAYSLALREGKAKAFGVKVSLIGAENVGKTCVAATLVGDPFQESGPTEGVDLSITDTSNWKKITQTRVCHSLQAEYLTNLKTCAESKKNAAKDLSDLKNHNEVDTNTTEAEYTPKQQIPTVDIAEIKKANATAMNIIQNKKGKNVTILDYAGQAQYHSTHSVFIRKENVIMVVFNASQRLSTNVKVRSSTLRSHPMSYSQNIHFWMNTVHSICREPGDESDKASLLPVILLVATHLDLIGDSAEEAKEEIIQTLAKELEGKPYAQHLAGHREGLLNALRKYCIFLSNKHRDPMAVCQLQDAIVEVSSPILSREHPLVYLKIESVLLGVDKGVITKEEFHAITYSCGFLADKDSEEFAVALEHFHHCGSVLHFASIDSLKELVIVSPHWLTKLFSYVLIAHPYNYGIGAKEDTSYRILTGMGILRGSFLTHMLESFNKSEHVGGFEITRGQTVDLMKKFGFLAQISPKATFLEEEKVAGEKEVYIVPFLLSENPTNEEQMPKENDDDVRVKEVYFRLPDGFLPPMLFDQMVTACINRNDVKEEEILW